jgi:hypothetical protein
LQLIDHLERIQKRLIKSLKRKVMLRKKLAAQKKFFAKSMIKSLKEKKSKRKKKRKKLEKLLKRKAKREKKARKRKKRKNKPVYENVTFIYWLSKSLL